MILNSTCVYTWRPWFGFSYEGFHSMSTKGKIPLDVFCQKKKKKKYKPKPV